MEMQDCEWIIKKSTLSPSGILIYPQGWMNVSTGLREAPVIYKLEANLGYWEVVVDEGDPHKTVFLSHPVL